MGVRSSQLAFRIDQWEIKFHLIDFIIGVAMTPTNTTPATDAVVVVYCCVSRARSDHPQRQQIVDNSASDIVYADERTKGKHVK